MQTLVFDVQRVILEEYANTHAPLWCLVCRAWATVAIVNGNTLNRAYKLRQLARGGYDDVLQWIWRTRRKDWSRHTKNLLMSEAARGGHAELVRRCRDVWNAGDRVQALIRAARGGHEHVVRLCHEDFGLKRDFANDPNGLLGMWDKALESAARGGHDRLVHQFLELCSATAVHTSTAVTSAARGGHEHLVRLFRDGYGVDNRDSLIMAFAASGGHERLVRVCRDEWGATADNWAMIEAAGGGHIDLVRLCHDAWGARDVTRAMIVAAQGGHADVVRLCHDAWGATDTEVIEKAKQHAHMMRHGHIVQMCQKWIDEAGVVS